MITICASILAKRKGHDMKKALAAVLLSVILMLPVTAVQAGHYYYGHGGYHSGSSDDILIAAGIIGGFAHGMPLSWKAEEVAV